jgi:hypothetical protein
MNTLVHSIMGLIIGTILYLIEFFPNLNYVFLFILFSVLIDIDHLIFYFIKYKPSKIKKDWLKDRKTMHANFYVFHSPLFNLFLLVMSFFYFIFLLIFISNLIHISLDILEHYLYHKNFKFIKEWCLFSQIKKLF